MQDCGQPVDPGREHIVDAVPDYHELDLNIYDEPKLSVVTIVVLKNNIPGVIQCRRHNVMNSSEVQRKLSLSYVGKSDRRECEQP